MATSITPALRKIRDDLNPHSTAEEILEACVVSGQEWRARVFDPVLTVQAWLLQARPAIAMTSVSFTASAYCQALQRLPVEVVRSLLGQFASRRRAARLGASNATGAFMMTFRLHHAIRARL